MMKRILFLMTILSLTVLMGCVPTIKSGKIVDKGYHKPYEEDTSTMMMVGEVPVLVSDSTQHPEEWFLIVEGYDEKKQKQQVEVTVQKEEYDIVNIGDDFQLR